MEELLAVTQSYFNKMMQYSLEMFSSWILYTALFAFLGLAIGTILIIVLGKKGYFKRPNSLWSVFAGLNYVYIPIVLGVFGGLFGSIYGTHTCVNQFFGDTAKPLAALGEPILETVIEMGPSIPWSQYPGKNLGEIVAAESKVDLGSGADKWLSAGAGIVYESVINHVVAEAYIPTAGLQAREVLGRIKNRPLPSNTFIGLYRTVQARLDTYFGVQYAVLGWFFLPFLLLPFVEYLLFRLLARKPNQPLAGANAPYPSTPPTYPTAAAMPLSVPPAPKVVAQQNPIPTYEAPPTIPATEMPLAYTTPTPEAPTEPATTPTFKPTQEAENHNFINNQAMQVPETPIQQAPVTPTPPAAPVRPVAPATVNAPVSFEAIPASILPPAASAITYVLGGALLQLYAGMGSGWVSVCVAIFGFVVFYTGLEKWKIGLDTAGQSAAKMLKLAAIIGAVSAFIDLIPFFGILATLGYLAAFVLELIGFVTLKSSKSIGIAGKNGATMLIIAMALALLVSIFAFIPYFGGFIAGPLGFIALILVFFGWVRVQEGMASTAVG